MKDKSSPERGGGDVRANCWTCAHMRTFCRLACVDERGEYTEVGAWRVDQDMRRAPYRICAMPPRTADGCPGWEVKP